MSGTAVIPERISDHSRRLRAMVAAGALIALAGCEDGKEFSFRDVFRANEAAGTAAATDTGGVEMVERDVEAPEVFQATEAGLWDGRPSLGGVWVAHPDVTEPERVMIRNTANGEFVVGALFRRERDIPGPRLQVSSDAAQALKMLAGAPAQLNVTALRKEQVAVTPPEPVQQEIAAAELTPAPVETAALDPVTSAAAAAIDAAPAAAPAAPVVAAPAPAPDPAAQPPRTSSLRKPYLQVGIFSVESNAERTADQMRAAGVIPSVIRGEREGKPFWRVVVGPAQSRSERSALLGKIKDVGFTDAYPVTN